MGAGAHEYVCQERADDSIFRCQVVPGLWLDEAAFWDQDAAK
jgi:hypothetical protein